MAIVYIGTESMERSTSFLIHLRTSNFCAIQTARNLNLNALGTQAHRIGNSHLDGTTISNLTFNLARNTICDNHSIQFRTLHLEDIDLDLFIGDFLQLLFQLVNFLPTFSDNKTRTRRANRNRHELQRTLDNNPRYTCTCQTCIQILTNPSILKQILTVLLSTIPIRIPPTDNS